MARTYPQITPIFNKDSEELLSSYFLEEVRKDIHLERLLLLQKDIEKLKYHPSHSQLLNAICKEDIIQLNLYREQEDIVLEFFASYSTIVWFLLISSPSEILLPFLAIPEVKRLIKHYY